MSTGGAPRAPGHSLTAQAVEWLSEQSRVQLKKKKMKERRKKREKDRGGNKKEGGKDKERERRKVGRQARRMDTVSASDLTGPLAS